MEKDTEAASVRLLFDGEDRTMAHRAMLHGTATMGDGEEQYANDMELVSARGGTYNRVNKNGYILRGRRRHRGNHGGDTVSNTPIMQQCVLLLTYYVKCNPLGMRVFSVKGLYWIRAWFISNRCINEADPEPDQLVNRQPVIQLLSKVYPI